MAEHIIAVFRTDAEAAAAERDLETAGVPSSAIRRYATYDMNRTPVEPTQDTTTDTSGGGFWAWLFGEESTSETTRSAYADDMDLYDRRVAAGNIVVSVTVDDAMIHHAITVLDAHHPLDIDEHSTDEHTSPASRMAPMAGSSTTGMDFSSSAVAQPVERVPSGRVGAEASPAEPVVSGTPAIGQQSGSSREEVIPLAEEQLEIGKRTVDRGTTRIRRYVVEKPVEQEVTLRQERVTVERRQPIEGAGIPGAGAFEERVVEVRETAEEPVVAKTARVAEEVVVGRETTERTETVTDTVRRDEVEVSGDGTPKR
jgi:uncharacterized protein (TIGR02271 family)